MLSLAILISVFSVVVGFAPSVVQLGATANVGNSIAASSLLGAGQSGVIGNANAGATKNTAFASAEVIAIGGGKGKGKDDDKYKPYPPKKDDYKKHDYKPKPYPKPHHKKAIPYPVPKKHYDYTDCHDIKDDKCYYIDEYYHCAFCVEQKYPIKGYGCKYTEKKVKKHTGSKKVYDDYEIVYEYDCDCKSEVFIFKGKNCYSCDYLLKELLECAGVKDTKKEVEISEKCIKEVGVTIEYLVKCGFVKKPTPPSKKEKEEPKVVVITKKGH